MKKQARFLKKLHKLYKKYNMAIDACGCCDSPFLVHLKHSGHAYSHIRHLANGKIKSIKPVDLMASYIRRGPKLSGVSKPLKDINIALNDSKLISKVQKRLNDLH